MVCFITLNLSASLCLEKHEFVGVVGSVDELGSWNLNKCMKMKPKNSSPDVWEATFQVTGEVKVNYRYFVGVSMNHVGETKLLVKEWECHLGSRTLFPDGESCFVNDGSFGIITGCENKLSDNGWLTEQHELRFSIFSTEKFSSLELVGDDTTNSNARTEVSSYQIFPESSDSAFDPVLTKITPLSFIDVRDKSSWRVNVPTTSDLHYVFKIQCFEPRKEYVKFNISHENGKELGVAVLSCHCLPSSMGFVKVPIISKDGAAVATLRVSFLHIKPYPHPLPMEQCFTRHWRKRSMIHAGHRGSGNSFTSEKLANVFENTVASLCQAANQGASYLEFDVHLTKDEVPIIYHDLTTCVAGTSAEKASSPQLFEVAVKSLLLSDLQTLKMSHKSRLKSTRTLNFDESNSSPAHRPFPTLKDALETVPPRAGFNIEIKWPTLDENGLYEDDMEHYFDANRFLDAVLKVVFESANSRKIIFSCFAVDICIMLRRKQNRYPVLFLTNGDSGHYTPLLDPREASNEMAIGTAAAEGFLGLDTLEKDVYTNPGIVQKSHDAGLIFACYGDNVGDNLDVMKKAAVDIAIYDRVYENKQLPSKNGFQ